MHRLCDDDLVLLLIAPVCGDPFGSEAVAVAAQREWANSSAIAEPPGD